MWRGVTRGFALVILSAVLVSSPATAQQQFYAAVETPAAGSTVSGMVLVKGWALDSNDIARVELYVDDQFQHRANLNLPRIDVLQAYPDYPGVHQKLPGFMTGFNASRFTNGEHTLHVVVVTTDNVTHEVGRRTIVVDKTINQTPFGSVDIPNSQGVHNASGSFPVVGWAADTDGIARIDVLVDDLNMQGAVYGDLRPDVANSFPDFPAAMASGFVAHIDTTRLLDGVHTLTVRATDRLGLSRVIGRRTIQVYNTQANLRPFGSLDEPLKDAVLYGTMCGTPAPPPLISPMPPPLNAAAHLTPVRGWALDLGTRADLGRVAYVELMIDGVRWYSSDMCSYNSALGAYVNCYGLPRYDVARYYSTYPDAVRSGFLFTLDIGGLINLGVRPGRHVLKVRVGDMEQTFADIPNTAGIPVFFTCAENDQDFKSLGYIDYPTPFEYLNGVVTFHGWALDQNPGGVRSVDIYVDGVHAGTAQYGFTRTDVRTAFPMIQNSLASGWRFVYDTRQLADSAHRLTVRVTDAFGNVSEIGSVDFYTDN